MPPSLLRITKPPPDQGDVSFERAKADVAEGKDALPPFLCAKMYRAWDLERALRFEPELEQMLGDKLSINDRAGFDLIVERVSKEFDEALRVRALTQKIRFGGTIGAAVAKMTIAVISAIFPKWFQ